MAENQIDAVRALRTEYTDLYDRATLPTEKAHAGGVVEGVTLLYARLAGQSIAKVEERL